MRFFEVSIDISLVSIFNKVRVSHMNISHYEKDYYTANRKENGLSAGCFNGEVRSAS